jgi:hypothetical protein
MTKASKDKDQEKGDEVLRRLLKTSPKPKRESEKAKVAAATGKKVKRPTGES